MTFFTEGGRKEMETDRLTNHQPRSLYGQWGVWFRRHMAQSQQWSSTAALRVGPSYVPKTHPPHPLQNAQIDKKTLSDPPALSCQPRHVYFYSYCKYSLYLAETFHFKVFEARQPSGVKDLKCQKKLPASPETSVVMVWLCKVLWRIV